MKRKQFSINNKINYLYFHIIVIYKTMCLHLILTRQYKESFEFLRGATQAKETVNVQVLMKKNGTLGQIVLYLKRWRRSTSTR